jgi:hypothetical protein
MVCSYEPSTISPTKLDTWLAHRRDRAGEVQASRV